jgi:ribulose-bisphosphate carboxylase large chain
MEGEAKDVKEIDRFMRSSWYGLKPTMPIASGGMHPGLVPRLIELLSTDLIITFGGGLWGHPDGPEAGARAIRQSVDAVMEKVPLKEYAEGHEELMKAIEFWD